MYSSNKMKRPILVRALSANLCALCVLSNLGASVSALEISDVDYIVKQEENNDTIQSRSFTAGVHSAINETILLDSDSSNDYYINVKGVNVPIVSEPSEERVEDFSNIAIANVNQSLNIRAEANENSEVLGKLYAKGAATVLETLDGWYKIESGSVTGYVSADYVIVGDEAVCKEASEQVATVTTQTLKLRKEPSTEAQVYTLIGLEQKAPVLDDSVEGWVKIKYDTYEGYVSSEYVTIEREYSYAESKEEERIRLEAEERARQQAAANKNKNNKNNSSNKNYNAPSGGNGQAVVNYGMQFIGNPYVWGGTSLTNGADCSGFVMSVYKAFGVSLPHSSYSLRSVGYGVSESQIMPGDIVCYQGHVGIYIGNGQLLHASNKRDGIKVSPWKYKQVLAIRRVL